MRIGYMNFFIFTFDHSIYETTKCRFFPKYYRSLAEVVQMFRDVASTVGKFFIFKFRGSD